MQLLKLCKSYGGNTNIEDADMNERALLMFDNISDFLRLCVLSRLDYCFAGFPGAEGSGSMFRPELKFAISSQSTLQDAAWEFLKFASSARGQSLNTDLGFSVNLSVLEDDINYTVNNGVMAGSNKYGYSKDAAQEFMDLINSTTTISNADIVVTELIITLTEPYFAGTQR